MKKIGKILVALMLVGATAISLAACSKKSGGNATLEAILAEFKKDESYTEYKAQYPKTKFKEEVDGDKIIISASGKEGVSGKYEFSLDGDYLTYTQKADSEDYVGQSYFIFLMTAAEKYLGMNSTLVNGYIAGCNAFDVENGFYSVNTDETTGDTTMKLYIAGKFDMPEIDKMYINDKALEYCNELGDDYISGGANAGKTGLMYSGKNDDVYIVIKEYGGKSDLSYRSIMNAVAKLKPVGYDAFAKEYTELTEAEGENYKVTFGYDELIKEHFGADKDDDYEYIIIRFGA